MKRIISLSLVLFPHKSPSCTDLLFPSGFIFPFNQLVEPDAFEFENFAPGKVSASHQRIRRADFYFVSFAKVGCVQKGV